MSDVASEPTLESIVNDMEKAEAAPAPEPVKAEAPAKAEPAASVEPAAPVTKEEVKVDLPDRTASKFAALARKQKETAAREAALAAREKEMEARSAQAERVAKALSKKDEDPIQALVDMGIDPLKYADAVASWQPPADDSDPVAMLRKEIAEMKAEKAKEREQAEQYTAKQREQAVESFKGSLTKQIDSDEKYELIQSRKQHALVYEVIEQHYQTTGELLSNAAAADMVEASLEAEVKSSLSTKKVKAMLEALGMTPKAAAEAAKATVASAASASEDIIADDEDEEIAKFLEQNGHKRKSKTMALTNDVTSSMPPLEKKVEEDDDETLFKKAVEMLKYA